MKSSQRISGIDILGGERWGRRWLKRCDQRLGIWTMVRQFMTGMNSVIHPVAYLDQHTHKQIYVGRPRQGIIAKRHLCRARHHCENVDIHT